MHKPYVVNCAGCGRNFFSNSRRVRYHLSCNPIKKNKKYSRRFKHLAGFIRIRDNFRCQECNKDLKFLDPTHPEGPVHHIDGNPKNNNTENLVLLCVPCHLKIHKYGLKKFNVKKINIPKDPIYIKTKKELFKGI